MITADSDEDRHDRFAASRWVGVGSHGGGRCRICRRAHLASSCGVARPTLAVRSTPGMGSLGCLADLICNRVGGACLGSGRGLELRCVQGLLPLRRFADGRASRRRLAPPSGCAWRHARGLALLRRGGRGCGRSRAHRSGRRDRTPRRSRLSRVLPGARAIVGNTVGTVAAAGVACFGLRRRRIGNTFILLGIGAAAIGSTVAGLGEGGSAAFSAVAAALLYGGFVAKR
jgi:hypothetical protein